MNVRIEGNRRITTSYLLRFQCKDQPGSGFLFPCSESGDVKEGSLNPCAAANYRKCVSGEFPVNHLGVSKHEIVERLCGCGSGKVAYPIHDGHGYFLCYVCEDCESAKLSTYRPDILERYEE